MLIPETPHDLLGLTLANESEVETKLILHIFRFLGYSDRDRADKPTVAMKLGREKTKKRPDFIYYDGGLRAIPQALVTVEAKHPNESLDEAESQAISYSIWAGTPIYVACNGVRMIAAQVLQTNTQILLDIEIEEIEKEWSRVEHILSKEEVVKRKDTMFFLAERYLGEIDKLPAAEFFEEYIRIAKTAFAGSSIPSTIFESAYLGSEDPQYLNVSAIGSGSTRLNEAELAAELMASPPRRILLIGGAGSGKTTLARRTTKVLLDSPSSNNILPIYVQYSEIPPSTIAEAFESSCKSLGVRTFRSLIAGFLQRLDPVLILDGVDELDSSFWPHIHSGLAGKSSRVLLSSRPGIDESLLVASGFERFDIAPLSDEDIYVLFSMFVSPTRVNAVLDLVRADSELRSPLMALLLLRASLRTHDLSARAFGRLFRSHIETAYEYFTTAGRRSDPRPSLNSVIDALSECAVIIRNHRIIRKKRALLADCASRISLVFGESVAKVALSLGIIYSETGTARFIHSVFEEYLVATRAVALIQNNDWLGVKSLAGVDKLLAEIANIGQGLIVDSVLVAMSDPHERTRTLAYGVAQFLDDDRILQQSTDALNRRTERYGTIVGYMSRIALRQGVSALLALLDDNAPTKHKTHIVRTLLRSKPDAFLLWYMNNPKNWASQYVLSAVIEAQARGQLVHPTVDWSALFEAMPYGRKIESARRLWWMEGRLEARAVMARTILSSNPTAALAMILLPMLGSSWKDLPAAQLDQIATSFNSDVYGLYVAEKKRLAEWLNRQRSPGSESAEVVVQAIRQRLKDIAPDAEQGRHQT